MGAHGSGLPITVSSLKLLKSSTDAGKWSDDCTESAWHGCLRTMCETVRSRAILPYVACSGVCHLIPPRRCWQAFRSAFSGTFGALLRRLDCCATDECLNIPPPAGLS